MVDFNPYPSSTNGGTYHQPIKPLNQHQQHSTTTSINTSNSTTTHYNNTATNAQHNYYQSYPATNSLKQDNTNSIQQQYYQSYPATSSLKQENDGNDEQTHQQHVPYPIRTYSINQTQNQMNFVPIMPNGANNYTQQAHSNGHSHPGLKNHPSNNHYSQPHTPTHAGSNPNSTHPYNYQREQMMYNNMMPQTQHPYYSNYHHNTPTMGYNQLRSQIQTPLNSSSLPPTPTVATSGHNLNEGEEDIRGRAENWHYAETKQFVQILLTYKKELVNLRRHPSVWTNIAAQLRAYGYERSVEKCKNRWKVLVAKYKKYTEKLAGQTMKKDPNMKQPNAPYDNNYNYYHQQVNQLASGNNFEFYYEMHELLSSIYSTGPDGLIKRRTPRRSPTPKQSLHPIESNNMLKNENLEKNEMSIHTKTEA